MLRLAEGPRAAAGEAYNGEHGHRLSALESKVTASVKVLSTLKSKLAPLQEVADATQSITGWELQGCSRAGFCSGSEGLEGLAAAGAGAAAQQ